MGFPAATIAQSIERARTSGYYGARLPHPGAWNESAFVRLPVTSKNDLRAVGATAFLATEESLLQYHESFGTTGSACGSWFTRGDYARDLARVRDWTDAFEGCRVMIRFPYALSMPAHLAQRAVEERGGCIVAGDSRTTVCSHARAARLIRSLRVTALACSPFESLLLAEARDALGLPLTLDSVCVAGELLSPAYQRLIEDAWSASVCNLYGSTETGALATSCARGPLHACDGQFIEILHPTDDGRRLQPGDIGRVVVTTLDREAMPLIRYDTGDYAAWRPSESCPCGRSGIVVEPHGRTRVVSGARRTERQLIDAACAAVRNVGARIFRACVVDDVLSVRVEMASARAVPVSSLERSDVRIVPVAEGAIVDREALLAECTAQKAHIVESATVVSPGSACALLSQGLP